MKIKKLTKKEIRAELLRQWHKTQKNELEARATLSDEQQRALVSGDYRSQPIEDFQYWYGVKIGIEQAWITQGFSLFDLPSYKSRGVTS